MSSTLPPLNLRDVRNLLYEVRRKWYSIGIELNLDIEKLDTIESTYKEPERCLIEMIKLWLKSANPTWKALADALKAKPVDEEQLSTQVLALSRREQSQATPTSVQATNTTQQVQEGQTSPRGECTSSDPDTNMFPLLSVVKMSDYEKKRLIARLKAESTEINQKFGTLVAQTEKSLEDSNIEPRNLKTLFNVSARELANIIKETDTISQIMNKATTGNYWTFFNYGLLKSIIDAYCKQLITELQAYISEFKEFCKRRIYEVPRDVLQAEFPPSDAQNVICVKLEDDFSIAKPFAEFLQVEHNISKIIGIEHLHLIHVKDGCIELTFRYFTGENIIPSICHDEHKKDKLKKMGVIWIRCGEQELNLKAESKYLAMVEQEKLKKMVHEAKYKLHSSMSAPDGADWRTQAKLIEVSVNFEGNRTILHLSNDMKISLAIYKAAQQFHQDPGGLSFLYHGIEISQDETVGLALAEARDATVVHMIKKRSTTPTTSLEHRDCVYGYCRKCFKLTSCHEVLTCSACRQPGFFHRSSSEPLKHFSATNTPSHLIGRCSSCQSNYVQAEVAYECETCNDGTRVSPLRQVRTNTHNVCCMKCGHTRDPVIRFTCQSRHCMCVDCFGNMCKQLLHTNQFSYFDNVGYSVSCPGSGRNCKASPVPDPHYFQIVDEQREFYEKFKQMSISEYQPPGDCLLCGKCKNIIDFSRSENTIVTEPRERRTSTMGFTWYHQRDIPKRPATSAPRVRGKTTCSKCKLTYCVLCKEVWHEGDCRVVDEDLIREEKAFPIDQDTEKDSCWPRDKD